jgi:preprotein translocase subunit SecD
MFARWIAPLLTTVTLVAPGAAQAKPTAVMRAAKPSLEMRLEAKPGDRTALHYTHEGKPLNLEAKPVLTLADAEHIEPGKDEATGHIELDVTFDEEGAQKLKTVSAANRHRRLAILVDGKVQSAPLIESELGARLRITADLTSAQIEALRR